MIKTKGSHRTIYCSYCEANEPANATEFRDCIDEWKEAGWRMFKKDDSAEWSHICPSCRSQNAAKYRKAQDEDFT